jgi:4-alpha-glucanotransferase
VLRHHGIQNNDLNAVAAFMSKTRSRLLAISLEDLLGVVDQPNIPGTVDEHPNWRRRLPVAVDDIAHEVDIEALKSATQERANGHRVSEAATGR